MTRKQKSNIFAVICSGALFGLVACTPGQRRSDSLSRQTIAPFGTAEVRRAMVRAHPPPSSAGESPSTRPATSRPCTGISCSRKGQASPVYASRQPLPVPGMVEPLPAPPPRKMIRRTGPQINIWRYAADPQVLALRYRVIQIARRHLNWRRRWLYYLGKRYRFDCSGFVSYVYAHLGFHLIVPGRGHSNGAARIYQYARYIKGFHRRKIPAIGDVVFWKRTYDANKDGRLNDPWTHVAIVEAVDRYGTISFIHKERTRGIRRGYLNLYHPRLARNEQGTLNTRMRRCRHKGDRCMAGALWNGFATFLRRPLPLHLDYNTINPLLGLLARPPDATPLAQR